MLELGIGADIERGISLFVWFIFAVLIYLAISKPKTTKRKLGWVAVVLGVFFGPMLPGTYRKYEYQYRYAKAKAVFDERCKTAGEKVNKTADVVEGFLWQRWRPAEINENDQFKMTDPYGRDCGGEECIKQMLKVTLGASLHDEDAKQHANGYEFIETTNPTDGIDYKYTGVVKSIHKRTVEQIEQYRKNTGREPKVDVYGFALQKEPVRAFSARYGVTWEDISTPEDRKYWIAGGVIRIIDLQTNEIIAERTGYLMDPGQGNTDGQRSPWTWARSSSKACPSVNGHNFEFIRSVLKPKQED